MANGSSVKGVADDKKSMQRWREATARSLSEGAGALGKNIKEIGSESVKGAKLTYRGAQKVGQTVESHSIRDALLWFPRQAVKIPRFLLKSIILLLALFIGLYIAYLIIFSIVNIVRAGTGDAFLERGAQLLDNLPGPLAKLGLSTFYRSAKVGFSDVLNPSISSSKDSDINRYVEIKEVEKDQIRYMPDESIGVIVNAVAYNLARPSRATLNCRMEDYKGPVKVSNNLIEGGEYIEIPSDEEFRFSLQCIFVDGIKAGSFGNEEIKTVSGKAGLRYISDSETIWEPLFVIENNRDEINDLSGPDIVKGLDGKVTTKSLLQYNSAIKLTFAHFVSMPFTERRNYRIKLVFEESDPFTGNLNKINTGTLEVPGFVQLEDKDPKLCDLTFDHDSNEREGYKVYRLTEAFKELHNRECTPGLSGIVLGYDDCIENFKRKIEATCYFRFNLNEEEFQHITKRQFIAKADYEYEVNKGFIADVIPQKIEKGDVCKEFTEQECATKITCKWIDGGCKSVAV